jgi:L-lactate dehydrogenase complex protein LldF
VSRSEILERYVGIARAAGTHVEFITADDLPGRLAPILRELAESCDPAPTGNPERRVAALPASGWPQGLQESVEIILAASGYKTIMPREVPGGYAWDRDSLAGASIGITWCAEFLAETGSLVLPAGAGMGTLAALLPEVHLALSYADGCRGDLADYLRDRGNTLPRRLTLVTGPSRTGDIELTMTTGVHGPRKVVHFILDRADSETPHADG